MKKFKNGVLFLALAGAVVFSCTKENTQTHPSFVSEANVFMKEIPHYTLHEEVPVQLNRRNTVEAVGVYHNLMLDDLLTDYKYPNNDAAMEEQVKENTPLVFNTYFPGAPVIDLDVLDHIPNIETPFYSVDLERYDALISNIEGLSSEQSQVIVDYITECIDRSEEFTGQNISLTLIEIENDYINNKGGNFAAFYSTAAIFRYSLMYHYVLNKDQKLSKWWKRAIGDAVGGRIGGVAGGGAFSVLGALQGAAAGSTIADLLWD